MITDQLASAEEIIAQAADGKMFILIDDELRENEGDLVIPAQHASAQAINFMARFGRGLICLALDRHRVCQLGLPLIAHHNLSRHQTAFTVSIEARSGVTTGISAADRARTIEVAIDPHRGAADIVSPGHVFPLVAQEGGVLVRAGHTEAAVDIARLAGCQPAGVICEIMNDDGTMARLPDLLTFASCHGLRIGTIADLINYRLRNEKLVERVAETQLKSRYGGWFKLYVYATKVNYVEHIALVKGQPDFATPVLTRMHALHWLEDVLGTCSQYTEGLLQRAMTLITQAGQGVLVLLRDTYPNNLSERVKAINASLSASNLAGSELREYGIGAQILLDLGVRQLVLLTDHPKAIIGLEGYQLSIAGYQTLSGG